jgi:DMSO/TMAO reductase YedYZ molybdopterin-dependent catalytic subunit
MLGVSFTQHGMPVAALLHRLGASRMASWVTAILIVYSESDVEGAWAVRIILEIEVALGGRASHRGVGEGGQ